MKISQTLASFVFVVALSLGLYAQSPALDFGGGAVAADPALAAQCSAICPPVRNAPPAGSGATTTTSTGAGAPRGVGGIPVPTRVATDNSTTTAAQLATLEKQGAQEEIKVAPAGIVGKVALLNGVVTIIRDGGTLTATDGMSVYLNDTIKTALGTRVQILFDDNTVFALGSDTTLVVEEYVQYKESRARFTVLQGSFKVISGRINKLAPRDFIVETKGLTTVGSRGVIFVGRVEDRGETIGCLKGELGITEKAESAKQKDGGIPFPPVTLQAGEMTFVAPQSTFVSVSSLSPEVLTIAVAGETSVVGAKEPVLASIPQAQSGVQASGVAQIPVNKGSHGVPAGAPLPPQEGQLSTPNRDTQPSNAYEPNQDYSRGDAYGQGIMGAPAYVPNPTPQTQQPYPASGGVYGVNSEPSQIVAPDTQQPLYPGGAYREDRDHSQVPTPNDGGYPQAPRGADSPYGSASTPQSQPPYPGAAYGAPQDSPETTPPYPQRQAPYPSNSGYGQSVPDAPTYAPGSISHQEQPSYRRDGYGVNANPAQIDTPDSGNVPPRGSRSTP